MTMSSGTRKDRSRGRVAAESGELGAKSPNPNAPDHEELQKSVTNETMGSYPAAVAVRGLFPFLLIAIVVTARKSSPENVWGGHVKF
jgi:hypothetical protein